MTPARLSLLSMGVGLATYAATGLLVRPDALLVRYGMRDDASFRIVHADRADHGDRPVIWVIGSSVLREAIDAEALQARLNADGVDVDVQKFAMDRGAPVFARALMRHLPVQAGDTVVTSLAEDNFTPGWLHEVDDLDAEMRVVLDPIDAWSVPGLAARERVDLALAMLPPRSFHRHRDDWIRGFDLWTRSLGGGPAPVAHEDIRYQPFTRGARPRLIDPASIPERVVNELVLDERHENWASLVGWLADLDAIGANAVLLEIPHHPDFGRHFLCDGCKPRFDTAIDGLGSPVWRLPPAARDDYADWNHPNDTGRLHYTAALAARLR